MAHIKTGLDSVVHVLYHYPCPDGVFAALAAYLRFRNKVKDLVFVPHSVYTAIDPSTFPPKSHAYLLDYVGNDDFSFELAQRIEKVTVIDHHITAIDHFAKKSAPINLHSNFARDKSGATLALSHFSQEADLFSGIDAKSQERISKLFSYIEDNDLWTHKLPFSKEFSAGLRSYKISYDAVKNPTVFEQLMGLNAEEVIEKGKTVAGDKTKQIEGELNQSFMINIGGAGDSSGKCLAVLSSYPENRSELGHQLAEKSAALNLRGIGCVVYSVPERPGELKVSMRSLGDDTTVVAKKYGGGGHHQASSFFVSEPVFKSWIVA